MAISTASLALEALERGAGILRLAPTWVPRSFCVPGQRIKLHPHDYFALGGERGGIDERWLSSTVRADNGPLTGENEGLSFVVIGETSAISLLEVVAELGHDLIGDRIWSEHGGWPMYSKFFDNLGPLPFHVHHRDEHAQLVGRMGKPEAYYYPPQMNNHGGQFPFSFLGLEPGTTREDFKARLARFGSGDNRITELSKAYRLSVGTGWDIPAGVLHAPGSLCTYEPQKASDVFAMCECLTGGRVLPPELLWKDVPEERKGDLDFIVELLDWDANVAPDFEQQRMMLPMPVKAIEEMEAGGYLEKWVVYKSDAFSASELTVQPAQTVNIIDAAAYGLIAVQGYGTLGGHPLETPTMIRYGENTFDEYFVSEDAARAGVTIANLSSTEPLVLLKHFGPGNPALPTAW